MSKAWVTAEEWFAGGQRIWYHPESARVLTERAPGALQVFERVSGGDADVGWLTMLPGFPDGSYYWKCCAASWSGAPTSR